MVQDICYLSATELAEHIRSKDLSPVEVVTAHLDRIDALNHKLNAVVTLADGAIEDARKAEDAVMRGAPLGALHGVPFTSKDSLDGEGVRTTRGSMLFKDHMPAQDATAAARLKQSGGIFLGHTNVPEFVFWFETDNLVFGRTENPWLEGRTSGGSSGGEAAGIAAGLSPLGIGSDLACSIRQPASLCGIVGLKPTHGRVPLTGHWPETLLRFMHIGPMARTVQDVAVALTIMAGPDGVDPYAVGVPVPSFDSMEDILPGLKVGWCMEGPFAPVASVVKDTVAKAARALESSGYHVEPVSLEGWNRLSAQDISLTLFTGEVVPYLEPLISGHECQLSPPMQRRLEVLEPSLREYQSAWSDCEHLRHELARFFSMFDLLLCPTTVVPAHPHSVTELEVDTNRVPPRNAVRATVPFDLTGSPAISVPFGWSAEGLPIGVQLVSRHFEEKTLLQAASALERAFLGEKRRPPV